MFGMTSMEAIVAGMSVVGVGLGTVNMIKGHALKKRVNNLDTFLSYDSKSAAVKVTTAPATAQPTRPQA